MLPAYLQYQRIIYKVETLHFTNKLETKMFGSNIPKGYIKIKTLTHYGKYWDQNQEEGSHLVKAPSTNMNNV